MAEKRFPFTALILLAAMILLIFFSRTLLAARFEIPRLFDIFTLLTLAGCVVVLLKGASKLSALDWLLSAVLGCGVGVGMYFATLFTPYSFLGIIDGPAGQALVRGAATFLASLGGLAIMHQGGPIIFRTANREPGKAASDILLGLAIGLPLAFLNVFALQFTMGRSISWQNPAAALLDALQPAIVEEFVFRFALWGLLWLILRRSLSDRSVWASGFLALLIHNFSHYDELFIQSPLTAIGMGLVVMVLWGLPPTLLARFRGLEAAVAFHWIQDAARFLAGY